jgi:hypothetical protein
MEMITGMAADRRNGRDRRKFSDPHYQGRERRGGADRRGVRARGGLLSLQPFAASRFAAVPVGAPAAAAHRLVARNDQHFFSPLVVVNRLGSEFAYVEADEAAGHRHVLEIMSQLDASKGNRRTLVYDERRERLDSVKDRAVYVHFGDDPSSETEYLCTVVIPGEPLVFQYESAAHESGAWLLLKRCAKVLGYDIDKVSADVSLGCLSMHL